MKRPLQIVALTVVLGIWFCGISSAQRPLPGEYPVVEQSSFKKLGNSTFHFLKVAQTARSAGMGDAFVAVADDINAIFWNPAALTQVKRPSFTFGYIDWLMDTKFYSGAIAFRVGWESVVGVSLVRFQPGNIEETTIYNPQGTGKMIDVGDLAVGVSFARQLTDKLSVGAHVKYLESRLGPATLRTVDFDVGTVLYTGFSSSRLAMSLKNLGGDQTAVTEPAILPTLFNLGAAMEVYGKKGDPVYLTASIEGSYAVDYGQRIHVGGEFWLVNTLALRGGYKFNYNPETFSLGAGLKRTLGNRKITVDVAYTDFGNRLNAPLRFSIGGSF